MFAGELLGLEQRGLALSATALRFAYAYGGDGEVRSLGAQSQRSAGSRRRAMPCNRLLFCVYGPAEPSPGAAAYFK